MPSHRVGTAQDPDSASYSPTSALPSPNTRSRAVDALTLCILTAGSLCHVPAPLHPPPQSGQGQSRLRWHRQRRELRRVLDVDPFRLYPPRLVGHCLRTRVRLPRCLLHLRQQWQLLRLRNVRSNGTCASYPIGYLHDAARPHARQWNLKLTEIAVLLQVNVIVCPSIFQLTTSSFHDTVAHCRP